MKNILMFAALPLMLAACGGEAEAPAETKSAATETATPATAPAAPAAPAAAETELAGKQGTCKVESIKGQEVYEGVCTIDASEGGSMVITGATGGSFVDGLTELIIQADTPTVANLSVRGPDGELIDTGTVRKQGDCWSDETLEICATL